MIKTIPRSKEKRSPTRPLSIWASLGLLITVFLSCGLMGWLGFVNPFTNRIQFDTSTVYWDPAEEKLSFFAFNPEWYEHGYYSLGKNGVIRREWKPEDDDDMKIEWNTLIQPSPEQISVIRERYDSIPDYDYTLLNEDTLIVVTKYTPPLQDFYSEKLHIIKDGNFDSPLTIDTITLFQVDMNADRNAHDFIVKCCLLITCLVLSVLGIHRLSYRYTALLTFIFGLAFCVWFGLGVQGFD